MEEEKEDVATRNTEMERSAQRKADLAHSVPSRRPYFEIP